MDPSILIAAKAAQSRPEKNSTQDHESRLAVALNPIASDTGAYSVLTLHVRRVLATEVAPHVRNIAAYDRALEIQRAARLASFGGRLTRAARSVIEGVERGKVRRERWIPGLNLADVLQTAGHSWRDTSVLAREQEVEDGSSVENLRNDSDNDAI